MGTMWQLIGATLAVALTSALWLGLLRGIESKAARTITGCTLSLLTVTIIAGYGNADGGDPKFVYAFGLYAGPQIVILALLLWKANRDAGQQDGTKAANPVSPSPREEPESRTGPATDYREVEDLNAAAISSALGLEREQDGPTEELEPFSVDPPAPRETERRQSRNPIVRHWLGGYSLGVSYWGVNVLTNVLSLAVITALSAMFSPEKGYEPSAIFLFTVGVWVTVAVLTVWQIVGLWRSANGHAWEQRLVRRTTFWARAAQIMAVIALMQLGSSFLRVGQPQIAETYRMAFQGDPDIPSSELTVLAGGMEIGLVGGIKYGLASELRTILKATPAIHTIHLTSPGGRVAEAKKVFDVIREYGLNTYVPNMCASACTLLFAAGGERVLLDGAQLGFHSASFVGATQADIAAANADWAELFQSVGVESLFIRRALSTPPDDMWFPTPNELNAANVVTSVSNGSGFAISGQEAVPSLEAVRQQVLESASLYGALERAEPESAYAIYELFRTSSGPDVQSSVQRIVVEVIRRHFSTADNAVLVSYAILLADTYEELLAVDPQYCFDYAMGTANAMGAYKHVSSSILKREQELNELVLTTSIKRQPPTVERMSGIWEEVGVTLSSRITPFQYDLFVSGGQQAARSSPTDYCIASTQYFRSIAELAPDRAGDLLREVLGV